MGVDLMDLLIVMCGISGSGKTTKAKELASRFNAVIVSTDEIRQRVFKDVNDQKHNREVFRIAYDEINMFIELSYNVIFDATNIKFSSIKKLKKNIKHWNDINRMLYIMDTPIEKAIEQNNKRDRIVPTEVIIKQANTFKSNREKIMQEFTDVRFN